MNTLFFNKQHITARFFAVLTIISMILTAFPVGFFIAQAATSLHGPDSETLTLLGDTSYESLYFDASGVDVAYFSFDFDGTTADNNDSVEYGWKRDSDATENILGQIDFKNGLPNPADIGSINATLPVSALVSDLIVFIQIKDGMDADGDKVDLTNIKVVGEDAPIGTQNSRETAVDNPQGQISICHVGNDSDKGIQAVNLSSVVKGTGHGAHTDNIIPPFWYQFDSEDPVDLYLGQNWDDDGIATYRRDCAEDKPVDLCENLDGNQSEIPAGYELESEGICVLVDEPDPKPREPKVCSYEGSASATQGKKNNGNPVDANRGLLSAVEDGVASYANFGGKEGDDWQVNTLDFYSMGINGELVYEFADKIALDQAGPDIAIWEITGGPAGDQSDEKVEVWLSENGVDYELADTVIGDGVVDIADTTLDYVKFVKLIDKSNGIQGPNGDGYDLDAITIIDGSCSDFATIHTSKIVCTDETDLPNGDITRPVTEETASDWISKEHPSCELVRGWEFEWGPKNSNDPGDSLVGSAGGDWTTFTGSIDIPKSDLEKNLWMREVLRDGYLLFTHEAEGNKNTDDVTAEMYCHTDAKNYDNFDRIDGPKVGEDYYCVAWNVPVEQTSDVTLCKYDEEKEALSGWQLALLGDKVEDIAVQPDGTTQSLTNVPAGEYVLKADGAYEYRGNTGLLADARFSERKAGDAGFGAYPYQPWREASVTTGGLAVQVNADKGALWGSTYSPSHVYYGSLSQAVLGDVDFYVYDNAYSDNVGEIDVELFSGRTGITGENGCITFEGVPYGEYEIEELLQVDWENVSGLGSVVVDEDSEIFTVINKDTLAEPKMCHLPYLVTFGDESEDTSYSTSPGTGLVIEEITDGYKIGLYDDGRPGVYRVNGTIMFPIGTDTSSFTFSEEAGNEGLEQTHGTYPDVADRVGNKINFDLFVNGANDIFSIVDDSLETVENCSIPTPEPEPEFGPHCGNGVIDQLWEQCDGDDVQVGESCTDYCTLDNQCSSEQLVKITLTDTDSASFDGSIHLDMAGNTIPNGTWFNFGESVGNETFQSIANAIDGLAVKRDTSNNKLALAFVGGNATKHLDIVTGTIMTKGITFGDDDRTPNPQFKLEDGSGNSFDDVFDKNVDDTAIDFDLRADTGNDGVTVEVEQGSEYDCVECKAEIEARVVIRDVDGAAIANGGVGNLTDKVILGDGTEVAFGEWFKISEAPAPNQSAEWIDDDETVSNFSNPETKDGLFVSREGNGKVKVALYGFHNPGGDTNYESLRATLEFNDGKVLGGSTDDLPGDFRIENHSEIDGVISNDNFDSFEEAANLESVDFDFWVDTKADAIVITLNDAETEVCDEDTDPKDPDPKKHTIEGYKYVVSGDSNPVPYEGWRVYASDGSDQDPLSTTTDSTGRYYFEVEAGPWTISEEIPSGWNQVQVAQDDFITLTSGEPAVCKFKVSDHEYMSYYTISETLSDDVYQDESYGYRCDFYNELDKSPEPIVLGCTDSKAKNYNSEATLGNKDAENCEYGGNTSSVTRINRGGGTGQVLGASTVNQCPFLLDFMQIGVENDRWEVMKLQMFLNMFVAENPVDGFFGEVTDKNVKTFQEQYRSEILNPWFERGIVPHVEATGFVYKTTLWKINSIICPDYAVLPVFDGEDLNSNTDID